MLPRSLYLHNAHRYIMAATLWQCFSLSLRVMLYTTFLARESTRQRERESLCLSGCACALYSGARGVICRRLRVVGPCNKRDVSRGGGVSSLSRARCITKGYTERGISPSESSSAKELNLFDACFLLARRLILRAVQGRSCLLRTMTLDIIRSRAREFSEGWLRDEDVCRCSEAVSA